MTETTQSNAFADIFKLWTSFSSLSDPNVGINAFITAQRCNAETLFGVNQIITESMQAIIRCQSEILQNNAFDALQLVKDVTSASKPENVTARQVAYVKEAFQSAISNTCELAEMVSKSNSEVLDVIGRGITENITENIPVATKKAA